ncbi:MAG: pyridoxal-phosphate dependent enzyme [Rhodothermales bacterium]|nr:pyridoxal-phosphate dependent enzyme [Rhodothermales bacterium]MBO6778112.1 pyridoxal-phosphate dependent enzyme [Rhodothermales bacterium]
MHPEPVIDPLLDGAHGDTAWTESHEQIAPELSLLARLEAFEDAAESEVGDTNMVRARHLERECGLRQLFLKFEGSNPSGTQKDRIAFAQAEDALRRGFDAVTVATCGNYGVATSMACRLAGLNCEVFIPSAYATKRVQEMEQLGARIHRVNGDYERTVEVSRAFAADKEIYDANAGGDNTALQLKAYGQIAYEIYDELRDAPAVVAVSVSNGTTLAGVHRGFVSLYRRGKTSRIPRMVAGSSFRKNPIVLAWKRGLETCEDLEPGSIRETETNEPLVNWHSLDGDHALHAVRDTDGWCEHASDRVMKQLARTLLERESLGALPAATAGLHALLTRQAAEPLAGDRYVAVLTGKR